MKVFKTKKIGMNRGVARLWIEGKSLIDHGWTKGRQFKVAYNGPEVSIYPIYHDAIGLTGRTFTVAGTETRPIIDLNNKTLVSGVYTMTVTEGLIKLEPNEA